MHKGSSFVTPTVLETVPITESDSIPQLSSSHTVSLLLNHVPRREKTIKSLNAWVGRDGLYRFHSREVAFLNQVTSRGLKNGVNIKQLPEEEKKQFWYAFSGRIRFVKWSDRSRKKRGREGWKACVFQMESVEGRIEWELHSPQSPSAWTPAISVDIRLPRLPQELILWDEAVWLTHF